MKKILLKTRLLYKYGTVSLLIIMTSLGFVAHLTEYDLFYDYINEIIGFSLYTCYRELYTCYYGFNDEKCKWQKSAVWGLITFCIINLLFMEVNSDSEYLEYITYIRVGGPFMFTLSVLYNIWIEEMSVIGKIRSFKDKNRSFFENPEK